MAKCIKGFVEGLYSQPREHESISCSDEAIGKFKSDVCAIGDMGFDIVINKGSGEIDMERSEEFLRAILLKLKTRPKESIRSTAMMSVGVMASSFSIS